MKKAPCERDFSFGAYCVYSISIPFICKAAIFCRFLVLRVFCAKRRFSHSRVPQYILRLPFPFRTNALPHMGQVRMTERSSESSSASFFLSFGNGSSHSFFASVNHAISNTEWTSAARTTQFFLWLTFRRKRAA